MAISLMQEFALETCCNCGVAFAIPQGLQAQLRANGNSFYCPNGHSQQYTVTTVQKLERQLAAANQATEVERRQRIEAERLAHKIEGQRRKLAKRISGGVCPCCNRTFQNLMDHMKTQHKGFGLPPAPAQKQIEAPVAS